MIVKKEEEVDYSIKKEEEDVEDMEDKNENIIFTSDSSQIEDLENINECKLSALEHFFGKNRLGTMSAIEFK